ncbi:MAG: alpha-1,2-fucosyltransferase [Planctomycetales bacterium]|jgi:hypothetical protein
MIVTRLIGGLGNQMFQYAFGSYLANQTDQELLIDVSGFETYSLHALAINHFSISADQLAPGQRRRIPGRYQGTSRLRDAVRQLTGRFQRTDNAPFKLRREKPFGFHSRYLAPRRDLYLDGYWQSEAFFPDMRTRLRQEFNLSDPLSQQSTAIADQMTQCESVAVHVRRGDYVTNPETGRIYRNLNADYYRACLRNLQQFVPDLRVFLFSNDIDWCRQHLDMGIPFSPVTHNDASTAYEDLYLMSQCRHAIIANSTFSWWGAFLGADQTGRRVYYPDPWFCPGTLNGDSVGCNDWISERSVLTSISAAA